MKTLNLAIAILLLTLAACTTDDKDDNNAVESQANSTPILGVLNGEEDLLATVNGSPIGRDDLAVYTSRTIGSSYAGLTDNKIEERILQSLVASRAIAQAQLKLMANDDINLLEKRVAQFREELLVKRYLLDNADPHSISDAEIKHYYEQNIAEFNGQQEHRYELLTVPKLDYKKAPKAAMDLLSHAKTESEWAAYVLSDEVTQNAGPKLQHNILNTIGSDNLSQVETAVTALAVGKMSRIILENGSPYIVRLLDIKQKPAKTLVQARAEISKRLLPASIKKSVKSISEQVLAESTVIYP